MKWKIKLSSRARLDIEDALEWTLAHFGQRKHDEYLELIGLSLDEIANNPKTARARQREDLHLDAWVMHIGRRGKKARHLFVYRIHPGGKVDVGRFLYDSMDIKQHLVEGF